MAPSGEAAKYGACRTARTSRVLLYPKDLLKGNSSIYSVPLNTNLPSIYPFCYKKK